MEFCHLHVHDEYSLLDGFGRASEYVKRAKQLSHKYLALTNHGNIDGLIKFQKTCLKADIQPVMGCEAYIVPVASRKEKGEKRYHITLLIKNEEGFQNLCKLLTKANLEGMYYKPRIDFQMLKNHCKGLVVLTGCSSSPLRLPEGENLFKDLCGRLGDDIYLEVMPHNTDSQKMVNKICQNLSASFRIPMVMTNDCHYVYESDARAHEVLLAIQTKAKWTDADRYKFSIDGFHMRDDREMAAEFSSVHKSFSRREISKSLETTIEIAEKCSGFRIPKKEISLPMVPGYEKEDPGEHIWKIAEEKLIRMNLQEDIENKYSERLSLEWELINAKKFAPYFMVVWELISWCHKNNIMVGPGRGSVGGSLLAYLLGITTVDPMKYGLLFSRFIAEDRNDFPDIDMDFEDRKRHLVREHLEKLYGEKNIASLSTFLKMKGRTTVRDVARVFDVPLKEVDAFAKTINDTTAELDDDESAIRAATENEEGAKFAKKYPHIIDYSVKLEGLCRGAGQHAAAVLVSAEPLNEGTRCNLVTRADAIVANWDMGDSEHVGLIKLDVLGLNTLSVLNETKRLIALNTNKKFLYHPESDCYFVGEIEDLAQCNEIDFEFEKIPLDDSAVYEEISKGHNIGAFQLSAWATTKIAKEIKPTNLNELSDTIALVRPGPLASGMTDSYIKRKHHGQTWVQKHPRYEKIVEDTYGIVCYQEQVMDVIYKVAGLPYSTADRIRKVIGKKRDPKEFKPYEEAFVEGCLKEKTFSEKEAREFWLALQSHAQYSFNRSHSVEYAIIGYWTAWCKHHFPTEFISASLTYGADDKDKKEELVEEAERLGLIVKTPKIGISEAINWVVRGNELYAPFIEIKGIGEKTAEECAKIGKANTISNKNKFFSRRESAPAKNNGKLDSILRAVGAYGDSATAEDLSSMFNFPVSSKKCIAPNLIKLLNNRNIMPEEMSKYMSLDITRNQISPLILESKFTRYKSALKDCNKCELRKECKRPVGPSSGTFNLAIVGEAPGEREDEQGKGLVGRSGDLTWETLAKHDLQREDFHVTNSGKCYPSISKTPNKEQLEACRSWLVEELTQLKPVLILAFGNIGMQTFTGVGKGITAMNGKTTWCEEFSCWICWCVHPAAVLRNPAHKVLFEEGIENFSKKIDLLAP